MLLQKSRHWPTRTVQAGGDRVCESQRVRKRLTRTMPHYNIAMKIPATGVAVGRDWGKWRMNATTHPVGRTLPKTHRLNKKHLPHISSPFFLALEALSINGGRDLAVHPTVV